MNASPAMDSLSAIQSLVLDLLAPARRVAQARVDALTEIDWRKLLDTVRQHRIGPLLHWQLSHAHAGLLVPPEVQRELAEKFQAATLRSLQYQRELLLTHRMLDQAGMAHMALKGAGLAWTAYPHPALRPLRDLDILVPAAQLLQAYQVLLEGGLTREAHHAGQPEAMMQLHQHLPPLRSPSGTVNVELHHRLFHFTEHNATTPDLSESPGFWERSTTMALAQSTIRVASPTDQLLHLIVHAAYDHEFTNGPLLLSDMAWLLDQQRVDWPLFWSLAETGQHTRGCVLALALMQEYWGPRPVDWCGHAPDDDVALAGQTRLAAALMLRDFNASKDVNLQTALQAVGSRTAQVQLFLRTVFPPRVQIAATYPVSEHDWRVFLWYPVRWWRLAFERLPTFLRANRDHALHLESRQLSELRSWLQQH